MAGHDDEREEEINLGNQPYVPRPHPDRVADEGVPGPLGARKAHLEDIIGPSGTDAELVDAILQLPTERLIPWEACELPSRGVYYNWSGGTVEVRGMGQTAEKILATQRLAQSGESIDYLLRECVRFPDPAFDPMDMLLGDRMFLLYYLRGITHGNIYEFAITCPNQACQAMSTHAYDLNNLASTIRHADPSLGAEPFRVPLPYMSESTRRDVWVHLRFLRGRDTTNMLAMRRTKKRMVHSAVRAGDPQRRRQENKTIDDTLTENLQMVITSVMGVQDPARIEAFVARMHATDTAAIREWLRVKSPGIETTVTLNCPECAQEFTVELPVTESFFRPAQKR